MESRDEVCCPSCGEMILRIAKKCKHCGEWLNTDAVSTSSAHATFIVQVSDESAVLARYPLVNELGEKIGYVRKGVPLSFSLPKGVHRLRLGDISNSLRLTFDSDGKSGTVTTVAWDGTNWTVLRTERHSFDGSSPNVDSVSLPKRADVFVEPVGSSSMKSDGAPKSGASGFSSQVKVLVLWFGSTLCVMWLLSALLQGALGCSASDAKRAVARWHLSRGVRNLALLGMTNVEISVSNVRRVNGVCVADYVMPVNNDIEIRDVIRWTP